MASFEVRVEVSDSITNREHCVVSQEALAAIGRAVGHQVRVRRRDGAREFALFTVREATNHGEADVVRVSSSGLERLGAQSVIDVWLDHDAVNPSYADKSDEEVREAGELIERLIGSRYELVALAPHGVAIEIGTDEQAALVARELRACAWICKGWKPGGGAFERWHIASTDIHEASFPKLATLAQRRFRHAVAFHGCDGREIIVGGAANETLKQMVASAVTYAVRTSTIPVRVAGPDDHYGGDDPRNIVNRLTASGSGGLQLEQPLAARERYATAIAEAVVSVYRSLLRAEGTPAP